MRASVKNQRLAEELMTNGVATEDLSPIDDVADLHRRRGRTNQSRQTLSNLTGVPLRYIHTVCQSDEDGEFVTYALG
jgi:hypothetical protein